MNHGDDGMNEFKGQTLSWQIVNGAIELALHRDPCNEIGSLTLEELEKFAAALPELANEAQALIIHSTLEGGVFRRARICASCFSAGRRWRKAQPCAGCGNFWSAFTP